MVVVVFVIVLRIRGFAKSRLDHSLGILGTLGHRDIMDRTVFDGMAGRIAVLGSSVRCIRRALGSASTFYE